MGLLISYVILGVIIWPFSYWYFVKKRGSSKGMAFFQGIGVALAIVIVVYYLVQLVQKTPTTLPASPTATKRVVYVTETPDQYVRRMNLNLDAVLLVDGDLPSGYSGGQITRSYNGWLLSGKSYQVPLYGVSRELAFRDGVVGYINLWAYGSRAEAINNFDIVVEAMGSPDHKDAPTWAKWMLGDKSDYNDSDIVFMRCAAVVIIEGLGNDIAMPYAQRLVDRLETSDLCDF